MITIFDGNCNPISQSFYDSVLNHLPFHRLTCSCGHSGCLSVHGYYTRSVKIGFNSIKLRICRVRCSECGKTHALLLSTLVPYSQIPLSAQQKICIRYESGTFVYRVCDETPSVDENNVKSVIRNYRHKWREKLRALRISLSPLDSLIRSCFTDYSAQFMQIRKTPNILFSITT